MHIEQIYGNDQEPGVSRFGAVRTSAPELIRGLEALLKQNFGPMMRKLDGRHETSHQADSSSVRQPDSFVVFRVSELEIETRSGIANCDRNTCPIRHKHAVNRFQRIVFASMQRCVRQGFLDCHKNVDLVPLVGTVRTHEFHHLLAVIRHGCQHTGEFELTTPDSWNGDARCVLHRLQVRAVSQNGWFPGFRFRIRARVFQLGCELHSYIMRASHNSSPLKRPHPG